MMTEFGSGYSFDKEKMYSAFLLHWIAEGSFQEVYEQLFFEIDESIVPDIANRRAIANAAATYVTSTDPETFQEEDQAEWEAFYKGWKDDQIHDRKSAGEWCAYCNENSKDPDDEYCEDCKTKHKEESDSE